MPKRKKIKKPSKICFLDTSYLHTKNKEYSAVGYYRMVKPAQYLTDLDIDVVGKDLIKLGKTNEEVFDALFKKYDIVVTKNIDSPTVAPLLAFFADHHGKKLLVDLDDNPFAVRPSQPAYKDYHVGSEKLATLASYLSLADGIICSTKPIADYLKEGFKQSMGLDIKTFIAPNFNDVKDFDYKPKRRRTKKNKNKFVIGWQGSTTHEDDLIMVLPAIINIMGKNKNVHLELLGGLSKEKAKALFSHVPITDSILDRVSITGGTKSWADYPKLLSRMDWDVGIAPLINDEFNRGKSHIKWMEYAMYKIPCVASKVYPYSKKINDTKVIRHGKNGYLAKTQADWEEYLQLLVDNVIIKKEIGETAYLDVIKNWQPQNHIKSWVEIFNTYLR